MDPDKTLEENIQSAIDLVLKNFNIPPNISRDDLSQDVWLKMLTLQRDGKFDPARERAFNYICSVARSEILDALKSAKREDDRTYGDDSVLEKIEVPPESVAQDAEAEKAEKIAALNAVWNELNSTEQEILSLYYIQGLSLRDAARRAGYSHQYFSKSLAKLLGKVRTKLGIEGMM